MRTARFLLLLPRRLRSGTAFAAVAFAAAGCANSVSGASTCTARGLHDLQDSALNVTSKDAAGSNPPVAEGPESLLTSGFVTLALGKDPYAYAKQQNAALKDRDKAQCNASFQFKMVDGVPGAQVTTASHCFRGMLALADSIHVDVYDPGAKAYFNTLEAWSPYLEHRRAFLADLQKANFSESARQITGWDFMPGFVGISRDGEFEMRKACSNGDTAEGNYQVLKEAGSQILCFSGADLVHFDIVFRSEGKSAPPDFLAFVTARVAEYEKRSTELASFPALAKARALYERRVREGAGSMESTIGNMIDVLGSVCTGQTWQQLGGKEADPLSFSSSAPYGGLFAMSEAEFNNYKAKAADICKRRAEFAPLAEKHMRFQGMAPSQVVKTIALKNPVTEITSRYQLDDLARAQGGTSIKVAWSDLVPSIRNTTSRMRAHFNLQDAVGKPIGPVSVPSNELGRYSALTQFLWPSGASNEVQSIDTVFVKVPNGQVRFGFAEGDSGTVLSFDDSWPLYVLAAVDGAPTSGGASVINLPRRNSASESGKADESASKNDKTNSAGKQTTDAGKGCGAG